MVRTGMILVTLALIATACTGGEGGSPTVEVAGEQVTNPDVCIRLPLSDFCPAEEVADAAQQYVDLVEGLSEPGTQLLLAYVTYILDTTGGVDPGAVVDLLLDILNGMPTHPDDICIRLLLDDYCPTEEVGPSVAAFSQLAESIANYGVTVALGYVFLIFETVQGVDSQDALDLIMSIVEGLPPSPPPPGDICIELLLEECPLQGVGQSVEEYIETIYETIEEGPDGVVSQVGDVCSSLPSVGTFTLPSTIPPAGVISLVTDLTAIVTLGSPIEVLFAEPLTDGTTFTSGIAGPFVLRNGVDALDLLPTVEDWLSRSDPDRDDPGQTAALNAFKAQLQLNSASPELVSVSGIGLTEIALSNLAEDHSADLQFIDGADSVESCAVGAAQGGADGDGDDETCKFFSPQSGIHRLGESGIYEGERYTEMKFVEWSQFRVDHIRTECSVNSTLELETHYTDASGHYLGDTTRWSSNLPDPYLDTSFADDNNSIENRSVTQRTIGTYDLDEVLADVEYRTVVYAEPGDQDENENFAGISQLGLRRGIEHPSNVFAKRAFYLYTNPKFRVHPATASWFKDDS